MPELPEVETIVQELCSAELIGKHIDKAVVYWHRSIAIPSCEEFPDQISGQTIQQIQRRGKFIVLTLTKDTLLIHLRMTGKILISNNSQEPIHKHERVRLYLNDGRILRYEDQRKFGKWYLLLEPQETLKKLGVEPLSKEFTLEFLEKIIQKHSVSIKSFLLNQKFIAGLGNIYVDEALWLAQVHPLRKANSLNQLEKKALHFAIIQVLKIGIENTGTSLGKHRGNYMGTTGRQGSNQHALNVFRRDGEPCPRCQTTIAKIVVAQRGTHLCPFCQKLS